MKRWKAPQARNLNYGKGNLSEEKNLGKVSASLDKLSPFDRTWLTRPATHYLHINGCLSYIFLRRKTYEEQESAE